MSWFFCLCRISVLFLWFIWWMGHAAASWHWLVTSIKGLVICLSIVNIYVFYHVQSWHANKREFSNIKSNCFGCIQWTLFNTMQFQHEHQLYQSSGIVEPSSQGSKGNKKRISIHDHLASSLVGVCTIFTFNHVYLMEFDNGHTRNQN